MVINIFVIVADVHHIKHYIAIFQDVFHNIFHSHTQFYFIYRQFTFIRIKIKQIMYQLQCMTAHLRREHLLYLNPACKFIIYVYSRISEKLQVGYIF